MFSVFWRSVVVTFLELRLACAIYEAGMGGRDPQSRRDRTSATQDVFAAYLALHDDSYFPFTVDQVCHMMSTYRKNKATQTKVEIAIAHGMMSCFWESRGKGPCSDDVEAGHLVPASQGGELTVGNCIIECRAHNNQRRAMQIEDYIRSGKETE